MAGRRLWSRFRTLAGDASVRVKIMGIVVVLILIFGMTITSQVRSSLRNVLIDGLENQGAAAARLLAARGTDLILTGNAVALHQLLRDTVESNDTLRYAIALDPAGNLLSSSFGNELPVGLAEANAAVAAADGGVTNRTTSTVLDSNEGTILDIASPVFGGRAGTVRVGMSTRQIEDEVSATTRRWLIVAGIVSLAGLLATYALTSVMTRPIAQLVETTRAIARGDLKRKAPVKARDEIGRLAIAFNAMTDYLAKARSDSETFQAELVRRNMELGALNLLATELSEANAPEGMLRRSLARVTESIGLDAGWILASPDGLEGGVICHTGLADEAVRSLEEIDLSKCSCGRAYTRKVPVVDGAEAVCPMQGLPLADGAPIRSHAAVPLVARSKVLGLLYVASPKPDSFSAEDLNLLSAMGYQMGVAVESAELWEELSRKEEIRGQLLEQTISAQEAERRRISRELHDQTVQSLTSLILGLRVRESDIPGEFGERIAEMRELASQTLDEVRNMAVELRPGLLDRVGLIPVLEEYLDEYPAKFGIETDFEAIGFDHERLAPDREITIYRIVQEALTNVAKHSGATRVSVQLQARGDAVIVVIEDDGKGFDVARTTRSTILEHKLGLHGMEERAALIGGTLTIESAPGAGTTIFVRVPLGREETT